MPKPMMNDIKVRGASSNTNANSNYSQKSVLPKSITQPKKPEPYIKPNETNVIPPIKPFLYEKQAKKSRLGLRLFLILIGLLILTYLVYLVSVVKITINPKIIDKNLNENVTLSSWVNPISSTVMAINESFEIKEGVTPEEAKKTIDQKIDSRFKFDTPKGYIIVPNCKTNTTYENIKSGGEKGTKDLLLATQTALAFKEDSLRNFLKKQANVPNAEIKDISKISCTLSSDIKNYKTGSPVGSVSFSINGEIKLESIVTSADIENLIAGTSKAKAINSLNSQDSILSYVMRIKPFNFTPLIPKNKKHIHIQIESTIK